MSVLFSQMCRPLSVRTAGTFFLLSMNATFLFQKLFKYADLKWLPLPLSLVLGVSIAYAGWDIRVTIDSTGDVGAFSSLAIINGNPAISYSDLTNGDLKYVRAIDANGTAWGGPIIVDGTGWVGLHNSLTIANGNPAISYFDAFNRNLKYVRAMDANGAVWGSPITVDNQEYAGLFTSLSIVNGKPAIAYHKSHGISSELRYVQATDNNGVVWNTPVTIDRNDENTGRYPSLTVINGNPAISYNNGGFSNGLYYVRAADADGTSWNSPLLIEFGSTGLFSSLAVVNGKPAYHI